MFKSVKLFIKNIENNFNVFLSDIFYLICDNYNFVELRFIFDSIREKITTIFLYVTVMFCKFTFVMSQ